MFCVVLLLEITSDVNKVCIVGGVTNLYGLIQKLDTDEPL